MRDILKYDFPASIVVTLVAIPLCLGIALASGAPMMAGVIAGIVGGLVVGPLSNSQLMVSGPAAGLTAVVLQATTTLGSWQAFLVAVVLGGLLQILFGSLKWGFVADYMPRSVVQAMLAAIGLILILKQFPHAIGYDPDPEGDENFIQSDGDNTFTALLHAAKAIEPGAVIISVVALVLLILFEQVKMLKQQKVISGPLAAVMAGVGINAFLKGSSPDMALTAKHLVSLPTGGFSASAFQFLDISAILRPQVWWLGVTIALVASLETLLSLDAVDRLDPHKRRASPDRELLAQGIGNTVSGLLGGLPVTGVIVRSAANVDAGARTKASAILHGMFLLFSVLLIPSVLNLIPLSALAAILIMTGYKLAKPSKMIEVYRTGRDFSLPFFITIVAIVATDLLTGIGIGLSVGAFFILKQHATSTGLRDVSIPGAILSRYELEEQVTFLQRAGLIKKLESLQPGTRIEIDGRHCKRIDPDVLAVLKDFSTSAVDRKIDYRLVGIKEAA